MAANIVVIGVVVAAAATLGTSLPLLLRRKRRRSKAAAIASAAVEPELPLEPIEDEDAAPAARELAAELMREERFYEGLSILEDPRVAEVVEALARTSVPLSVTWGLARSRANIFEPTLGLAALRLREDAPSTTNWAFSALKRCAPPLEPLFYALLLARADVPVIARALALCADVDPDELARFVAARREQEEIGPQTFAAIPSGVLQEVKHFIDEHADILGADLAESFDRWRATAVDSEFLGRVGKLWAAPFDRPETLLVGDRAELVEQMLRGAASRSRRARS